MVRRTLLSFVTLIIVLATPALVRASGGGGGGGSSSGSPGLPESGVSPEDKAAADRKTAEGLYDQGYRDAQMAAEQLVSARDMKRKGVADQQPQARKFRDDAQKRFKKAIDAFRKATDLVPDYHEAWNMLGFSYRKTGQIGNALKAYQTCLKIKPDYAPAHEYLGEARLMVGDMDKARSELEWLRKNAPDEAAKLQQSITALAQGDSTSIITTDKW